jgi:PadR family transcriptional regulator PadR
MRITRARVQVTLAIMVDPDAQHWGYDLRQRSGVKSGVLYPMLTRMQAAGWLITRWEEPATIQGKRSPRQYYELTPEGRTEFERVIDKTRCDRRFTDLFDGSRKAKR